jgi:ABC-type polysaccharide/polyol phosphate export permease
LGVRFREWRIGRPRKIREIWEARELLENLVARDLKVRYKNSLLGFAWSMLTPLATMLIFTFIFTQVFRVGPRDFPIFFLAGFLPWTYFSNSVQGSVGAIVGNGPLIRKVYFPREVLPLSTLLSQGVHFLLALAVFGVYMLIAGYNFIPLLPLLLVAVILQTIFNGGLAMAFAAANVGFRDLQELTAVIFTLLFYGTPIIYQLDMVPDRYRPLLELNPMTWFVGFYRQVLYYRALPSLKLITACTVIALVSLVVGYALFSRLAVSFAKEV